MKACLDIKSCIGRKYTHKHSPQYPSIRLRPISCVFTTLCKNYSLYTVGCCPTELGRRIR